MASVHFTAAIDRDLLKRAKVLAAKGETSLFYFQSVRLADISATQSSGGCPRSSMC